MRARIILNYEFDDANVQESVDLNQALDFVCGKGDVPLGLDEGIRGMTIGETRELRFSDDDPLFGARQEASIREVPLEVLPDCSVGDILSVDLDAAGPKKAAVLDIGSSMATLDFNHPLAGKGLSVKVTLLKCEETADAGVQVRSITSKPADAERRYARFGDTVTLHYSARAEGSANVDSSRDRGEPVVFKVGFKNSLPPGWEEGILRVPLGERATIRVPATKEVLVVEILDIESELELAF